MKRKHSVSGFILICAIFVFCVVKVEAFGLTQIRHEIEAGHKKLTVAYHQEDFDAIVPLYTDNATIMPPNYEIVKGKDAIKEYWKQSHRMGLRGLTLETGSVERIGDNVVEIGTYKVTVQPKGQSSMTDAGKYVMVWEKVDGSWKIHIDIWNTNTKRRR